MTQTIQTLTCPQGHTFPYEQLTLRDGLSVCPICDRMEWASPRATWSRRLLADPLVLLAAAALMFLVEAICGIGIGTTYSNVHVGGAGWLVAGSAVILVGIAVVIVGVVRAVMAVRSARWARSSLAAPFLLIALGAALIAIGDGLELGLAVAFLNASNPGAGWQLASQIFDTLFYAGIAGAAAWLATLVQRRDPVVGAGPAPAEPQATPVADPSTDAVAPPA
jgi:hypothetical protein